MLIHKNSDGFNDFMVWMKLEHFNTKISLQQQQQQQIIEICWEAFMTIHEIYASITLHMCQYIPILLNQFWFFKWCYFYPVTLCTLVQYISGVTIHTSFETLSMFTNIVYVVTFILAILARSHAHAHAHAHVSSSVRRFFFLYSLTIFLYICVVYQ